jgi:hypothetical protein
VTERREAGKRRETAERIPKLTPFSSFLVSYSPMTTWVSVCSIKRINMSNWGRSPRPLFQPLGLNSHNATGKKKGAGLGILFFSFHWSSLHRSAWSDSMKGCFVKSGWRGFFFLLFIMLCRFLDDWVLPLVLHRSQGSQRNAPNVLFPSTNLPYIPRVLDRDSRIFTMGIVK